MTNMADALFAGDDKGRCIALLVVGGDRWERVLTGANTRIRLSEEGTVERMAAEDARATALVRLAIRDAGWTHLREGDLGLALDAASAL